jgi:uncharacterized protein (TIGR02246 family)
MKKKDEQAIRDLVECWLNATEEGDLPAVLSLMADDVVFMVPGQEPFGKEAFAASARNMKRVRFESRSDIRELIVLGDWAWMRNHLEVTITSPNGEQTHRSGHTLTILRKTVNGNWVIARDANLLVPQLPKG